MTAHTSTNGGSERKAKIVNRNFHSLLLLMLIKLKAIHLGRIIISSMSMNTAKARQSYETIISHNSPCWRYDSEDN